MADRHQAIAEIAAEYYESYKLRHPNSHKFAQYALGQVVDHLGQARVAGITAEAIAKYQDARLREGAARRRGSTMKSGSCSASLATMACCCANG